MGGTAQVASTGADCRFRGSGYFRSCDSRLYIRRARGAKASGLALFAAWVVVWFRFFFVSGEYVYWSCPRCGKPLHYIARWYGRWNNPFARRCVHCGMPKWVDSDPDPKLKRELDPFRSDSVFKLGE